MSKHMATKSPAGDIATFSKDRPDWMEGGHRGSENVTLLDMTIPRLAVIQQLSPQKSKQNEKYIPGAEEGMVFNTVTNKLYKPPLVIVPCYFRKEVVLWKKRNVGGGFKGAFKTMEEAEAVRNAMPDKMVVLDPKVGPVDAYESLDTVHHFVLVVEDDGSTSECVMSLVKTGLAFSRKFNALIEIGGGDRFSRAYSLNTVLAKNAQGQEYFAWKAEVRGFVGKELYAKAESLYKAVSSGDKNVAYEAPDEG